MRPSRTENPVARTPNAPAARSPSSKTLPSGARRRTSNIEAMAIAVAETMIRSAMAGLMGGGHNSSIGFKCAERP